MPRPRMSMQLIREILRLSLQLKMSMNEIHRALGASRGKVQDVVRRGSAANLSWPLPEDDDELERLLNPPPVEKASDEMAVPDWEKALVELRRKGVTLKLLWIEYAREHPSGLSYSQYCRRYRGWYLDRDVVMRQEHLAGEKLFVDFVGLKMAITCRFTGEISKASVFAAVFGASNYCYAEAVASEDLRNWLSAHVRALRFFGGVPKFVVPDNLRAAVTDARRFDPVLNKSFARLAQHYGFGIMPARPFRPKDKAKVEKGVQVVEQRILAPLRHRTFFSVEELNSAISELLDELNEEPFQKLSGCRRSWFETTDLPALNPLPQTPFEFEEWILSVRVPRDYHIALRSHFYSVPYHLVGELVDIRFTDHTVEILHCNRRVASHALNSAEGQKTTSEEHMPVAHAEYQGMSVERFAAWSREIGPSTVEVIDAILNSKPYPQLSFDQCWGILRGLSKKHGTEQIEKACRYALEQNMPSYSVVKAALDAGVEKLRKRPPLNIANVSHSNIRGPNHYN